MKYIFILALLFGDQTILPLEMVTLDSEQACTEFSAEYNEKVVQANTETFEGLMAATGAEKLIGSCVPESVLSDSGTETM